MNGMQQVAGVNPTERAAQLFAFLGMLLVGFVVGAWEYPAHEPLRVSPALWPETLLLGMAGLLIAAAVVLAVRVQQAGTDGLLRDPLTALYRQAYVAEVLHQLTADDDREGRSRLALVLIEVEFLPDLRQRYGRPAVDELLTWIGRHVRGQVRECDLPSRDGDRFAVYLRCDELEQADAFSRRLSMLLSGEQFELQGDVVKVSVSTGAAMRANGEAAEAVALRAAAVLDEARAARSIA